VDVKGGGETSLRVNGQDEPGTLVDVVGGSETSLQVDGQDEPGQAGGRQGSGIKADVGQGADIGGDRDDNRASGGADDEVGAWPRRYISGPTVGEGPQRYTCGSTVGVGPRRYTFGHNEDDDARRRQSSTRYKEVEFGRHPTTDAGQSMDKSETRFGDPAIAGDPMCATQRVERPHRAVRRPERLQDFVL